MSATKSVRIYDRLHTWPSKGEVPWLSSLERGDSETIDGTSDHDVIFGQWGNDTLRGFGGNDHLHGQDGNDTLIGGAGADFLDGGADNDKASYSNSPTGVTVNLKSGHGSGGDAEGDILQGVEELIGSDHNDFLVGSDGDNYYLSGGAGNDTIMGGSGEDKLYGGDDNDTLMGGDHGDQLYGGEGKDILKGGGGADYLWSHNGNDHLYGDDGSDKLNGGAGYDYLEGGNGEDHLAGAEHNDELYGGANDDVLTGGAGVDRLVGGSGEDSFKFRAWDVYIDDYIEHHTDSPVSNPDHIADFTWSALEQIYMGDIFGTDANYIETEIAYNAGYLEARDWAEGVVKSGNGSLAFGFVTDGVNGYLFGDLNGGPDVDTGIVLEGLTSLGEFHWYNIYG